MQASRLAMHSLHTWHNESWAVGHLLILVEEVVRVLVEHHAANGLQREDVRWPFIVLIQGVKGKLVLVSRVHVLDHELPLRVVTSCNGLKQVLQLQQHSCESNCQKHTTKEVNVAM